MDAIKAPGERFNLILPGSAVGGELPLLHAAGISFVFIDQNEAYKIPGRSQVGIGKNALDRIVASLAEKVKWIRTLRDAWGDRLVQIEFIPREVSYDEPPERLAKENLDCYEIVAKTVWNSSILRIFD